MIQLCRILVFCLAASSASATGFASLEIPGEGDLPPLRAAIWYPCAEPPTPLRIGMLTLAVTPGCPVSGDKLPLVVLSHGKTGSFLGHRDTAEALAEGGFVAVAINHPGDTALDSSRTQHPSVFVERPADIRRTIDFMLGRWPGASRIDPAAIGVFGFSRGGYTGLVVAGANPRFGRRLTACDGLDDPVCERIHAGTLPELAHAPRVRAIVVADPLAIFFLEDSFGAVRVPVQLWRSERGGDGVTPESVDEVARRLPVRPDLRVVPGSGHFAFAAPCPPELAKEVPVICEDGPGFDRVAFHRGFNAEVLAFFRTHLTGPRRP